MDEKTKICLLIDHAEKLQYEADKTQKTVKNTLQDILNEADSAVSSMHDKAKQHIETAALEAAAATKSLKDQAAADTEALREQTAAAIKGVSSKVWLCALPCILCGVVVMGLSIYTVKLTTKGDIEAATAARQELEALQKQMQELEKQEVDFLNKKFWITERAGERYLAFPVELKPDFDEDKGVTKVYFIPQGKNKKILGIKLVK